MTALLAVAAFAAGAIAAAGAAAAAEISCRAADGWCVQLDGTYPPDARVFTVNTRGRLLVDLPSEGKSFLIDIKEKKAIRIPRSSIRPGATEGTVSVADPGAPDASAYALAFEGAVLRFKAGFTEVRVAGPDDCRRQAPPPGAGARPADDPKARACLTIEPRPVATGAAGCTKFVYLKNSCAVQVAAGIRRTEHLMTGTLPQTFSVVVPPGGEVSLGCAWWSGATAPSKYDLLAAGFPAPPSRPPDQH